MAAHLGPKDYYPSDPRFGAKKIIQGPFLICEVCESATDVQYRPVPWLDSMHYLCAVHDPSEGWVDETFKDTEDPYVPPPRPTHEYRHFPA